MKYIIVSADYLSTGIKDIDGNELDNNDLNINKELWCAIQEWIKAYNPIIMMENKDRISNQTRINELDKTGITLCNKIKCELGDNVKVEYYSEGLLKKITL